MLLCSLKITDMILFSDIFIDLFFVSTLYLKLNQTYIFEDDKEMMIDI